MHPFNPFRNDPPDFAQVARRFPSLRPYLTFSKSDPSYAQIDFHDPRAARELCYALMATKFNITLEIPLDSLIPPIPNRIDYLLWCLDLSKESESGMPLKPPTLLPQKRNGKFEEPGVKRMKRMNESSTRSPEGSPFEMTQTSETSLTTPEVASSQNEIWAIDVGTGCSCIYPLLGSRLDPRLRFVAIEVDERSAEYAQSNVEKNGLGGVIEVILNRDGGVIFPPSIFARRGYESTLLERIVRNHPTGNVMLDNNTEKSDELHADKRRSPKPERTELLCTPSVQDSKNISSETPQSEGPQYSTDILFPAAGIPYYSFAMCNPPFFRHPTDRLIKATLPSSTHSGSLTETVVPGGEVAFVKRMFEESRDLKDRVRWWTSLLGKKEDLETLKSVLRSEEVEVRTGRMRQGRTVRWSIGWSWKVGTT